MKRWLCAILTAALVFTMTPALAASYVTASTPLGSSNARVSNIRLAADAINGYNLGYGETFSFNDVVGARTSARGYQSAVNGRGVKVVGGGVAQVASTLYLALQQVDDISYDSLKTYGSRYNQDYVDDAADAILVDEQAGTDFAFTNYAGDMTIEAYTASGWLYVSLNFDNFSGGGEELLGMSVIYIDGNAALYNNIELASMAIDAAALEGGDRFSFNDTVGARTKGRGYESAVNGRGSKVVGGGVAQVASALWLAIKGMDDIAIIEKSTYGSKYNQNYVDSAADAILTDYDGNTDFSFRYTGSGSIRIDFSLDGDALICQIFRIGSAGSWSDAPEPTQSWWW